MKKEIFYHYSDKSDLDKDKLKFIKPKEEFNRPKTGIWVGKEKSIWKNYIYRTCNKCKVYTYKTIINLDNIYMLTIKNFQTFYKIYRTRKITLNDLKEFNYKIYNINWKKFIKNNPNCKGIYLTFDPHAENIYKNIKIPPGYITNYTHFSRVMMYPPIKKKLLDIFSNKLWRIPSDPEMFVDIWHDKSLCIWDKSAIIEFKLIK